MKAIAELTKDCLELPSSQRYKLARILLEVSELDRDCSPETEAAWEEEIRARMEAVKSSKARSRAGAEVFADLDRRYPE